MNRFKRILIPIGILCLIGLVATTAKIVNKSNAAITDENYIVVININVGHGDAALIKQGDEYGLIDAGPVEAYPAIDDYLNAHKIKTLKFIMFTHYDKDHIGGATQLLDSYEVETVFIPDYVSDKKLYQELTERLKSKNDVRVINEVTEFDWNELNIKIIPAISNEVMELSGSDYDNNMSLVNILTYAGRHMIFTGDIERDRIEEIIDSGIDIECDYLKIPHHGKYDKALKGLIKATEPKYAVISASPEDGIEDKTLQLLEKNKIKIFDTMSENVLTICNKNEIYVMYESEFGRSKSE